MWSYIWHTFFFDPVYNGLVFIVGHLPHPDVGVAIILLTIGVKLILLPLSLKAARAQHAMRFLEPELARIKEKYKDEREVLARETMAAYKKAGINPFAGILVMLVQIPFIIALYLAVYTGGGVKLPLINTDLLYSFVSLPTDALSMLFLNRIDIAEKSIALALLAGVTQYLYGNLSLPPLKQKNGATPDFKEDLMRSMQIQMKYFMPILIAITAYYISAAVALYFVVSNLVSIAQEYFINTKIPDRHAEVPQAASPKAS